MSDTIHLSTHVKGPQGYTLNAGGQKASVRGVRFGRIKSSHRAAGAILLALAISLGLWALVAAGWLILD